MKSICLLIAKKPENIKYEFIKNGSSVKTDVFDIYKTQSKIGSI